jgi:hypothetical protein
MIIVTWIARAFVAVIAVTWAAIGALAVRDRWRHAGRVIDDAALDIAVARHPAGSKLPGPGQPQPSGIGPGEDTGVSQLTADDVRWLRSISVKEEGTP